MSTGRGSLFSAGRRPPHSTSDSGAGIISAPRHSPFPSMPDCGSQRFENPSPGLYDSSSAPIGTSRRNCTAFRTSTTTPPGSIEPSTPISPTGSSSRADFYGRPLSQGHGQCFGTNNYVFSAPLPHQSPVVQHQQILSPQENMMNLGGYYSNQAPRRPSLQLSFLAPSDNHNNPTNFVAAHDGSGIPSSASSSYSTGSDLTRSNRSTARSSSVDWVDESGFLSPSPMPANHGGNGPVELLSPISLDTPVPTTSISSTSAAVSIDTLEYQSPLSYTSPRGIPRASGSTVYNSLENMPLSSAYTENPALANRRQQHGEQQHGEQQQQREHMDSLVCQPPPRSHPRSFSLFSN